jgi:hypothetical protein
MDKKTSAISVTIQVESKLVWKLVILGLLFHFASWYPTAPDG